MTEGSILSDLTAIAGTTTPTDKIYLVRSGVSRRATISQIEIEADQINDASAAGLSLLTAASAAAQRTALELGDLAELDTVGTAQIDDEAVTVGKMADLAQHSLLIGDASSRPVAFATTSMGRGIMAGSAGAAVTDASGGATIDAEARTALNALLARVRAHGLIAT